jgi:hypothetical protein
MSIFSFLGDVVGVVGKVVGVVASVFKVSKPIMEALAPAIPEVENALDWLKENAAAVGAGADDFLDRNEQTLMDLEMVSGRACTFFGDINALAAYLRVASQETSPDTITEEESAKIIEMLEKVYANIAPLKAELDTSLNSLKVAESEMENS